MIITTANLVLWEKKARHGENITITPEQSLALIKEIKKLMSVRIKLEEAVSDYLHT
jgi:hypothetical protein